MQFLVNITISSVTLNISCHTSQKFHFSCLNMIGLVFCLSPILSTIRTVGRTISNLGHKLPWFQLIIATVFFSLTHTVFFSFNTKHFTHTTIRHPQWFDWDATIKTETVAVLVKPLKTPPVSYTHLDVYKRQG